MSDRAVDLAVTNSVTTVGDAAVPIWVERLQLTDFRSYAGTTVSAGPEPVVLHGANGAGKTNLLEALSLLSAGQGLRRSPFPELARSDGRGDWAVSARVHTLHGALDIGTGLAPDRGTGRIGRIVRIDGETQPGSGRLDDYVEMIWLTPAMDGLFTGPASDRRRFLDRLILCFDPGYRTRIGQFERAMQQRNRLLADNVFEAARFEGLERIMAETGAAIAAARLEALGQLGAVIAARHSRTPDSPFPWARLALEGTLETALTSEAAVDVEDSYHRKLAAERERDRAAGRALSGPHRTDLLVEHGPKGAAARVCSTGEQKALLIGLILAHADLVAQQTGAVPILLLDEIAAHLDPARRAALFDEILALRSQVWMTGTEAEAFAALRGKALFLEVADGSARTAS